MMKIEIKEAEQKEEIEYPIVMESTDSDLTIFFTVPNKGFVLIEGDNCKLGDYSEGWAMDEFKPFKGTITITQD